MKFRLLAFALMLILLTSVSVGSLAYYTADAIVHNVITSGGVGSELIEKTHDDEGNEIPWPEKGVQNVMPGEDVAKIVTVRNTGASPAWIRVKLTKVVKAADGTPLSGDAMISYEVDTENWEEKGGWYYYKKAVDPDTATEYPIIRTVTFAPEMGNEYQGCTATIDVSAQAVQTANNGTSATEASGWPESDENNG